MNKSLNRGGWFTSNLIPLILLLHLPKCALTVLLAHYQRIRTTFSEFFVQWFFFDYRTIKMHCGYSTLMISKVLQIFPTVCLGRIVVHGQYNWEYSNTCQKNHQLLTHPEVGMCSHIFKKKLLKLVLLFVFCK